MRSTKSEGKLNGSELSFLKFYINGQLKNAERDILVFSVTERHRKELGILWSDGENRGTSRRSQEDWRYCRGSWPRATAE